MEKLPELDTFSVRKNFHIFEHIKGTVKEK